MEAHVALAREREVDRFYQSERLAVVLVFVNIRPDMTLKLIQQHGHKP